MSWGPNSIKARYIAAAVLLVTASAATANILVIRSVGPSAKTYPPGTRLPENGKIILKASDQLVLLDKSGTRTLQGPGNFALNAAPQRATATGSGPTVRRRIGATRGPKQPTPWSIDIVKGGTICVGDRNDLNLWREDPSGSTTLTITRTNDKQGRRLDWAAGDEDPLKWPSQLPVTEGAAYQLNWNGPAASTDLRFKILPKKPIQLDDIGAALLANGCTAQLDIFIEQQQKLEADEKPSG